MAPTFSIKAALMKKLVSLFIGLSLTVVAFGQNYWSSVAAGVSGDLLSISFGSDMVGYISGKDSLLLKTTDGGRTWNRQPASGLSFSLAAKDIVHLRFLSPTVGYAVISNFRNPIYMGATYKTTDGGATWSPVNKGNIAPYRTYFFSEDNGYQIGSAFFAGYAIERLSAGVAGNLRYFSYNPFQFLFAIDFQDTTTGITGGSGGYVYRTNNGGATWDTVKTNTDSAINAIRFVSRHTIVAATDDNNGTLIRSDDSGKTWQRDLNSLSFFYPKMSSLVRSKRDSLIAVGKPAISNTGVIYWYRNGTISLHGTTQPLHEVTMRNDSVAFAVGDSGLIVTNARYLLSAGSITAASKKMKLYPNPATGIFFVQLEAAAGVAVFDATGRMVYRRSIPSKLHEIDLSGAAKGIYVIKAEGQESAISPGYIVMHE